MAALDRFNCRCMFHVAVPDSVPDEMGALEHFTKEFRDRLVTENKTSKQSVLHMGLNARNHGNKDQNNQCYTWASTRETMVTKIKTNGPQREKPW